MALLPADDQDEYTLETRDISPAHLLTKIESFSMLWKHEIKTLESSEFESGGYKWKVRMNFDKSGDISANLCMVGTSSLPRGWEVNAIFNLFLYNHISDNYLCFRGKARRFHAINPECGFSKLITKESMTNGYLFKDKCVFGAEVFVMKKAPLIQNVCVHNVSNPYKHEWKISQFSKLQGIWKSEEFSTGGYKWNIRIYPNGDGRACGRYVSVFLYCVDSKSFGCGKKLNASCHFTFKNMLNATKDHSMEVNHWFTCSSSDWGFAEFKAIDEMRDNSKGFVVDDCCTLQIQLSVKAIQEAATTNNII
ncbi:uncharacterized protein LOC130996674 [Salvia miltiorrhiza]|uniref:uncharacterized protein LOC130996674 n=1 Tax=Salvia miltiorrhiza TaxID=226208 RepID=UPI0025AD217F|nr:uncharacterized protein LOC130996674 [Salvia miltiorrhiza]